MQKDPYKSPHEKEAPKADDGERIDPPRPADERAIRAPAKTSTSRTNLRKRRSAASGSAGTGHLLMRKTDALGWKERRHSSIVHS
jgi:hypothetical protein